jgi:hypothetical protein
MPGRVRVLRSSPSPVGGEAKNLLEVGNQDEGTARGVSLPQRRLDFSRAKVCANAWVHLTPTVSCACSPRSEACPGGCQRGVCQWPQQNPPIISAYYHERGYTVSPIFLYCLDAPFQATYTFQLFHWPCGQAAKPRHRASSCNCKDG